MENSIKANEKQLTTIPRNRRERDRLVKQYGDFQAAVAKSLGVHPVTVNTVWQQRSTSQRIADAIVAEINKRISQAAATDAA